MVVMSSVETRTGAAAVKTTAGKRAYEWIRDAILHGEFAELRTICRRQSGVPEAARALIEEMEKAGDSHDWNRFAQLDQLFHSEIVRHQRNAVISELYDSLQPRQVRLGTRTLVE